MYIISSIDITCEGLILTCHLFVDKFEQTLAAGKNPTVHDIGIGCFRSRVKAVINILDFLQQSNLPFKEFVAVPQGQEHLGHNFFDPGLLETQGLSSYNR
jgi:hypothetical protein